MRDGTPAAVVAQLPPDPRRFLDQAPPHSWRPRAMRRCMAAASTSMAAAAPAARLPPDPTPIPPPFPAAADSGPLNAPTECCPPGASAAGGLAASAIACGGAQLARSAIMSMRVCTITLSYGHTSKEKEFTVGNAALHFRPFLKVSVDTGEN